MRHARTLIREAAAEAIREAAERIAPRAQLKVFPCRTEKKFSSLELPACTVVTNSEDIEKDALKVALEDKQRALILSIGVCTGAATEEELGATLDALSIVVEAAIEKDISLGGSATAALYSGFEIETSEEGNAYRGGLLLRYTVIYQYAPDPDLSELAPLMFANVDWNLNNAQPNKADRVKDIIPVEQTP